MAMFSIFPSLAIYSHAIEKYPYEVNLSNLRFLRPVKKYRSLLPVSSCVTIVFVVFVYCQISQLLHWSSMLVDNIIRLTLLANVENSHYNPSVSDCVIYLPFTDIRQIPYHRAVIMWHRSYLIFLLPSANQFENRQFRKFRIRVSCHFLKFINWFIFKIVSEISMPITVWASYFRFAGR